MNMRYKLQRLVTDVPGIDIVLERNAFAAEGRTAQENEAFKYIKKLLNWRKANPVIHTGKTKQFISQDHCYVYFRYNNEKTVMVAIRERRAQI